jgi:hypothetical protein
MKSFADLMFPSTFLPIMGQSGMLILISCARIMALYINKLHFNGQGAMG